MSTVSPKVQLRDVWRVVTIDWTPSDYDQLLQELHVYVDWILDFLQSGQEFPSHIDGSGCLAVPICESTTPEALFAALGDVGIEYELQEHDEFWITIHYPNPEPVVTLIPKVLPGAPRKLIELCNACSQALGSRVGGPEGMFLAWLMPGFSWAMHTDHDNAYEQVGTRLHIPLITTPESVYVWGRKLNDGREQWEVVKHLEPYQVHFVRVDVPHTVVNRHKTEPRLHLILDVHEER